VLVPNDAGLHVETPIRIEGATMVRQLCVAEEALVGGIVDDASFFIQHPPKDAERIEIGPLASVVEPEESIAVRESIRHLGANDVIIASDLRDHVVGDENNDVPVPVDFVHVGIAGLDLVRVGTRKDPRPCTRREELPELGRVLHCRIVTVAGDSNPEEIRAGCEADVGSEGFKNAGWTTPRRTFEKDPHTL
jgi:hypothetical protein